MVTGPTAPSVPTSRMASDHPWSPGSGLRRRSTEFSDQRPGCGDQFGIRVGVSVQAPTNLGTSCAVTTLAGDVARSNPRARAAYTAQVGVYIEMLMRLLPSGTGDHRRARAITALSTLVGAISMARAVNDEALSQEILASAAAELKTQLN